MSGLDSPLSEALDDDLKEFLALFNSLKQKYSEQALLKMLQAEKYFIPCTIFNPKLSALETIVKYLVENEKLSLKKIAALTSRTSKNIWQAYDSSKKKHPGWLIVSSEKSEKTFLLPLDLLNKNASLGIYADKLTLFENIVFYLKDTIKLSYHEIAVLLKRDDRTIWSTYQRTMKKLNESNSDK